MKLCPAFLLSCLLACACARASVYAPGVIVPAPKAIKPAPMCTLADGMPISYPESLADCGSYLSAAMSDILGFANPTTPVVRDYGVLMWIDRSMKRPESYRLVATGRLVKIAAADADGCFHGIQTLLQVLRSPHAKIEGKQVSFPGARIYDYPDVPWRGMMFQLAFASPDVPTIKRMLECMARYKYNYALLEFGPNVQSDSHPEVTKPKAITREQCRELVQYCKSLHIAPIPGVNSLGHGDRTLQFPDLVGEGMKGLDLSKEETYETLFDVYSEILQDFGHPKYFHAGMDEAWDAMQPNMDRTGKSADDLVAGHIIRMNEFFRSKGTRMIIWHDMIVGRQQVKDGPAFGDRFGTWKVLDRIPKDVIIDFWSYDPEYRYPSLYWLRRKGFQVVGSPWFSVANISNICREAYRSGSWVLGTLWNEPVRNHASPQITPFGQRAYGQAIVLTAECAWNASTAMPGKYRYDPFSVFLRDYEERTERSTGSVPLDLPPSLDAALLARSRAILKASGRAPGVHQIAGIDFRLDPHRIAGWPGFNPDEPDWNSIEKPLRVVLSDGRSLDLDGVNVPRGEAQVVLYTPAFGEGTRTNRFGAEALLSWGRVSEVRTKDQGNCRIPTNGLVLSAHESLSNRGGYRFVSRLSKGLEIKVTDADGRQVWPAWDGVITQSPIRIPVARKAGGFSVLHALPDDGPSGQPVAAWSIEYADGTQQSFEVVAGRDVDSSTSPRFLHPSGRGAWVALAGGQKPGEGTAVYATDLANPHPEKRVRAISIRPTEVGLRSGLLVLAVSALDTGVAMARE